MSDTKSEGLPIPAHLASEFYVWLWWSSEVHGARFELPPPVGAIDLWIDERLAFRGANDNKVTAVMTGEAPSTSLEARAALAGGKVLQDLRIGFRRGDQEFTVTLKGPAVHLVGARLPQVLAESLEETLYDRMFRYGELQMVVGALFRMFAAIRVSDRWVEETLPAIRRWVRGED